MAWDDDDDMDFNFDDLTPEENERIEREMREEQERIRTSPIFLKAEEIFKIVHTISDTLDEEEREMHIGTLMESSIILAPKIAGAMSTDSWLLCMQNASIIRYHAQYLHTSTASLHDLSGVPKEYVKVLRNEMEEFRELFKEWVKSFKNLEHEDYTDEWGLFLRE